MSEKKSYAGSISHNGGQDVKPLYQGGTQKGKSKVKTGGDIRSGGGK